MQVIPIEKGVPNQRFAVALDGVTFVLRFFWNTRDESWYWELYDSALVPIWCGARIAVGERLLRQCTAPNRPAGELVAIDTRNKDIDPTLDDFHDEGLVKLIYGSAAEVAAALGNST
jgi:hypothetical protein